MMNYEINKLAKRLFDDNKIRIIEKMVNRVNGEEKDVALKELSEFVGTKPKRPLYYVFHSILGLPEYGTRDIIRYLGDYIDQLVRFTLEDKRFLSRWFLSPLGPNINKLKKHIDKDLYDNLILFNKIYTQAKHDFIHNEDKSLFTYIDAIYMIFITKELSLSLLPLSEHARDYNNHGKTFNRYDPID